MLPKSCSSDHIHKNSGNPLRKTQSSEGSDIFDYLDNGIVARSTSHFSGILSIAPIASEKSCVSSTTTIPPSLRLESSRNERLRDKLVGFIKKIIPVMLKKRNGEEEEEEKKETREKDVERGGEKKMMDSDSAVYEIDELNSTIAPSSSRQCIVGTDLECSAPAPKKPKKKAMQQRTELHPKPPFSCWPIYTAILLGLLVVLIVGAVTTIIDMRPVFLYGTNSSSTNASSVVFDEPPVSFSTLKPQ